MFLLCPFGLESLGPDWFLVNVMVTHGLDTVLDDDRTISRLIRWWTGVLLRRFDYDPNVYGSVSSPVSMD